MEVRSTDVQNNFGAYLKYAQFEDVFITRNSKRVGVLRGYESFLVAEGQPAYKARQPQMTLEEFLDFTGRSDGRYELVDGQVNLQSSPSIQHQDIVLALGSLFRDWAQGTQCKAVVAPFDVFLEAFDKTNVVQPDVVILCDLDNVNEKGRYSGVPAVVVEVLSESTRNFDMVKKLELYRAGGVSEYWIVNPFTAEVYVYTFQDHEVHDYRVYGQRSTVKSFALAGLQLPVDKVFA
ncbi:MAG: Uma2 family endonuclease [Limnochordia bacterium]|jgi:Uma2 family endonuclease|nr:Uma2 family endonuclease [Limnochordia bacterium]